MTLPSGLVLPTEPIVDIPAPSGEAVGLIENAALRREPSEALGRKVDLVSKRRLKPLIRDSVPREAIAAYAA